MSPQPQPPYYTWGFVQPLNPNPAPGHGVDHHNTPPSPPMTAGFPFPPPTEPLSPGPGPWDRRGRRHGHHGRHGHRRHYRDGDVNMEDDPGAQTVASDTEREGDNANEKGASPETLQSEVPDPAEVAPGDDDNTNLPPYDNGSFHRGPRGDHHRGGCHRGGDRFGGRHEHQRHPSGTFDIPRMMRGVMGHPFFRSLGDQAVRYFPESNNNNNNNDDDGSDDFADSFKPPVDVFKTERAFVLHVALPGAKKDDVGVNWIPETSVLSIAGVVHRPGDEAFLQALTSGERKVGLFGRKITLPPAGASDKVDVDGFGITAKMEDGILVITVPKVEKEWTEIRKVDIE